MKNIFAMLLLLGAIQVTFAGAVDALTITYTSSTPSGQSASSILNWSKTLDIQKFNSNTIMGNGHIAVLDSVVLKLSGTIYSNINITNNSGTDTSFNTLSYSAMMRVLKPSTSTSLIVTTPTLAYAPDGNGDPLVLSPGQSLNLPGATISASNQNTKTAAADLALFTGTDIIVLPVTGILNSTIGVSGSYDAVVNGWSWASLDVTYNYHDSGPPAVPEPGTIFLLGSGILAFGARSFSRFRRSS